MAAITAHAMIVEVVSATKSPIAATVVTARCHVLSGPKTRPAMAMLNATKPNITLAKAPNCDTKLPLRRRSSGR